MGSNICTACFVIIPGFFYSTHAIKPRCKANCSRAVQEDGFLYHPFNANIAGYMRFKLVFESYCKNRPFRIKVRGLGHV